MTGIATTPEIDAALAAGAPVALGVSGGKDSTALAFATVRYLDQIGHTGPRVLIHSDLGRVEWRESGPTCERLAERLGLELIVVRRAAGDMMDRWLTRWANNVERYEALSCVKLILPWSTPSMRFCTSELKTAIICRELIRRFPGTTILSATGIRRQESPGRAKAPVAKRQAKLTSVRHATIGFDWHPIIEYTREDVFAEHDRAAFPLHEAYTVYGSSRVSCAFCIMGSRSDLLASTGHPDHGDLYREMVDLEITSTFAFQSGGWLGDVAPHLLTDVQRVGLERAKAACLRREALESAIPDHLLFSKGWPTRVPLRSEAVLMATIRREVAIAVGLTPTFTDPTELTARYETLYQQAHT